MGGTEGFTHNDVVPELVSEQGQPLYRWVKQKVGIISWKR